DIPSDGEASRRKTSIKLPLPYPNFVNTVTLPKLESEDPALVRNWFVKLRGHANYLTQMGQNADVLSLMRQMVDPVKCYVVWQSSPAEDPRGKDGETRPVSLERIMMDITYCLDNRAASQPYHFSSDLFSQMIKLHDFMSVVQAANHGQVAGNRFM